jgi:DedD protein
LQEQLKERLTGAAILVVIVVLAIPEMFHGQPAARGADAASGSAAIPLRTYTIDLAATPAAQPGPALRRLDGDAAPPNDGAPLVPAAAPGGPPGVATGIIQRPPPEPAPVQEPPPKAAAAPQASPPGGWAVQVGSFSRKDLAERMTRQVHARGFPVQMVGPDARGLYRVRSPLLPDRAAAVALREKMVEKGFKPIINASP